MTEQLVLTLTATSIGFVSAVFFCIGNFLNSSDKIILQATPYYDFSLPVARALAAQRAQYTIGALLLVLSFSLQVLAAISSSIKPVVLPQLINTWPHLMLLVLFITGLVSGPASYLVFRNTMNNVLELERERSEKR